jgi:hypothetical protein
VVARGGAREVVELGDDALQRGRLQRGTGRRGATLLEGVDRDAALEEPVEEVGLGEEAEDAVAVRDEAADVQQRERRRSIGPTGGEIAQGQMVAAGDHLLAGEARGAEELAPHRPHEARVAPPGARGGPPPATGGSRGNSRWPGAAPLV